MSVEFSNLVGAQRAGHGASFSAMRADLHGLGTFASPIVGLDHFKMSGRTFASHPHAGFAAITYLFEDSQGSLRNHDSLGHDFVARAGELVWTQAGQGVVHDEAPEVEGHAVHGVQIFVNSRSRYKHAPPKVLRLQRPEVPVLDVQGVRVRVLAGSYGGLNSPLQLQEPFTLLDIDLHGSMPLPLQTDWNAVLYVMAGSVVVRATNEQRTLGAAELIAVHAGSATQVELLARGAAKLLALCGRQIDEPIIAHGPFIMNSETEIAAAIQRYQRGGMGVLAPLGM